MLVSLGFQWIFSCTTLSKRLFAYSGEHIIAATFQPFFWKYNAVALPIPLDAPVIKMVFLLIALLLAYLFSYLTNLKMVVVDRLRVYPKKYDYSSDLMILEMIYSSGNHYATG